MGGPPHRPLVLVTGSLLELRRATDALVATAARPVLSVMEAIAEHLGAAAVAHRPERSAGGWTFEAVESTEDEHARSFGRRIVVATSIDPIAFMGWDPLTVAPDAQNRVVGHAFTRRRFEERSTPVVREIYEPLGLLGHSHMRVLVADGTFLLRWFGLFREEPFRPSEEAAFEAVAPGLARRLALDRITAAGAGNMALFELIGLPAFLVTPSGSIVMTNEAGRAMLDREPSLDDVVVDATRGRPSARVHTVVAGSTVGVPGHHIVLLKDPRDALDARLARAVRESGLTPAEARVLERVIHGDANKDVAVKLGCALRTVEAHTAAILMKCRVESRARLIAWFWTR